MNSNNEDQVAMAMHGKHKRRKLKWLIPFFILFVLVIQASLFLWLWNSMIPELFNGPQIAFRHAFGFIIMAKLLFGFGGRGFGHRFGHWGHHGHHWRHMSHEDREKLRAELKERFKG